MKCIQGFLQMLVNFDCFRNMYVLSHITQYRTYSYWMYILLESF